MNGDTSFVSFAAVPIVVSIPENAPTETPSASPLSRYADPAGWSVDVPSGWTASPIDVQDKVSTRGVVIANGPGGLASPNAATPGPIGPDLGTASSDTVALTIITTSGGPLVGIAPDDDTPLPLSASDLQVMPGPCTTCPASMTFRSNGVGYEIDLWAGSDASGADIATAKSIIESFQGASLTPGTVTDGWTPLSKPAGGFPVGDGTPIALSGTPELQKLGVMFVMRPASGLPMYALDLAPDTCGEGQDQRWDPAAQQIRITCPDGTMIVYDAEGRPDAANLAPYDRRLGVYPVIRSWDGQDLPGVSVPLIMPPKWSWHWGAHGSSSPTP
jgi:hypothetical protein